MSTWRENKAFSDKYLPTIKEIAGRNLIGEAPIVEDREHNTDLIVLNMAAVRIACRVRRPHYYDRLEYKKEFTFRARLPKENNGKTELRKVIEGFGDYFFYGFGHAEPPRLRAYLLGDLAVFRSWFLDSVIRRKGHVPGVEQTNPNDGITFRVFRVDDMPPEFIVDRKEEKQ